MYALTHHSRAATAPRVILHPTPPIRSLRVADWHGKVHVHDLLCAGMAPCQRVTRAAHHRHLCLCCRRHGWHSGETSFGFRFTSPILFFVEYNVNVQACSSRVLHKRGYERSCFLGGCVFNNESVDINAKFYDFSCSHVGHHHHHHRHRARVYHKSPLSIPSLRGCARTPRKQRWRQHCEPSEKGRSNERRLHASGRKLGRGFQNH